MILNEKKNGGTGLISEKTEALYARLKKVLPFVISPGQTVRVDSTFIGESGRFTADILETTNLENIEGYLLAIDFEKASDSLNYNLLIAVLESFRKMRL